MNCPKCNKIIIAIDENGTKKLRSRILLFEKDKTIAVCPQCKTKIIVPIILDDKTTKTKINHVIFPNKLNKTCNKL